MTYNHKINQSQSTLLVTLSFRLYIIEIVDIIQSDIMLHSQMPYNSYQSVFLFVCLQVPHRLLTFQLTRHVEVCVLCGPTPPLSELEQEVLYINLAMRKMDFCLCENKGADQLCSNCTADQRLCFRHVGSTIPLLLKSQISSF